MTLELLRSHLPSSVALPHGYPFPMTSLLVNEVLHRGHEVVAYTTSTDIQAPVRLCYPPFTLCIIPSRLHHMGKTLFQSEIGGLHQAMREQPCDVINAQWTYEFAAAALRSGLPALMTLQDHARTIFLQYRDAYRLIRWGLNTYVVNRAKYLSVTSPYVYALLPPHQQRKSVIIPNFLNQSVLARPHNASSRECYFVSVCNGFSRRKNVQTALLAFRQFRRIGPHLQYWIVGEDCQPGGPAYEFCRTHGCLEGVVFVGPVPYARVIELVGNAVFMLHPSYEEAFGMSVLESMALGTPVIGGHSSGNIPYLIRHRETGLLCDVSRPASICDAIAALAGDSALRDAVRAGARDEVLRRYSASTVVDQYLSALERVRSGIAPHQAAPPLADTVQTGQR
jgi:glycosyltransferase involved in cell wall biosynthesis